MKMKYIVGIGIALFQVMAIQTYKTYSGNRIPIESEPNKTKGALSARHFLVVFSDFECAYCSEIRPKLDILLKAFPNDLRIVYKHYVLKRHAKAPLLAEAAECAADQKKFWEMRDKIYDEAIEIDKSDVSEIKDLAYKYSDEINLDQKIFRECLESGRKKEVIQKNMAEGENYRISGTPTVILNGKRILTGLLTDNLDPTIKVIESVVNAKHEN